MTTRAQELIEKNAQRLFAETLNQIGDLAREQDFRWTPSRITREGVVEIVRDMRALAELLEAAGESLPREQRVVEVEISTEPPAPDAEAAQ